MKQARLATTKETDALARKIKSASSDFKGRSDKFARESKSRIERFCKKIK